MCTSQTLAPICKRLDQYITKFDCSSKSLFHEVDGGFTIVHRRVPLFAVILVLLKSCDDLLVLCTHRKENIEDNSPFSLAEAIFLSVVVFKSSILTLSLPSCLGE